MSADSNKSASAPGPSYVLASRDYADIAHLENPSVIERILSATRTEAALYVGNLLQSGLPRYVLAGPKVALTAMAIEALADLSKEVSAWRKNSVIPEDFSGRPSGYQTWVELLREIDSNPVDADRLKAMKAMFLAANRINATDGESVLAYQLFQIARNLGSGTLLLLGATYKSYLDYSHGPRTGGSTSTQDWRKTMAHRLGHGLSALMERDERKLVEYGLIAPWTHPNEYEVPLMDARMTDLGIKFCRNIESYEVGAKQGVSI
jgi:hypothetical protein